MVKEYIENETSEERFKRLATARTNAVLDKLRVLGNCSNKAAYEYSEEDVKTIFSTIDKEVKKTKALFEQSTKTKFRL